MPIRVLSVAPTRRTFAIRTGAASLIAGSVLAIAPAQAQSFEGAVTMRLSASGGDPAGQEIEYLLRGGKARINLNARGRNVSMIAVPADKKMYMLMDAQNMYIEMSTDPTEDPRLQVATDAAAKKMGTAAAPKITRTGKKETIAGYECEHVLIETDTESVDACNTKALGSFVNAMSAIGGMGRGGRGGAAPPAWQKSLAEIGAFPLRITRKDGSFALEVTKVEKRAIAEAQFVIPSNYSKMNMPARSPGL